MSFAPSYTSAFEAGEVDALERAFKLAKLKRLRQELAESRDTPLDRYAPGQQPFIARARENKRREQDRALTTTQTRVANKLGHAIAVQGEPLPATPGRGSVAAAAANFGTGMRRMEGRVAQADLEAILEGRERPRRELAGSIGAVSTLRGVRKIGTLGAGGRAAAREAPPPEQEPVETAGDRAERARVNVARRRQEEAAARGAEAEAKGAEQDARSPLEREQDFASVKQFRGRKGVRELPAVRGVRRFGTTAEPVEPPGDPEQEMLERLTLGGSDIPSNVAQSLISRGTQRERLESQKAIRDANDRLRRDIADAGNDVALKQLAVRRWEADLRAAGLGAGLEINATRFGQVDAPGAFTGTETAPNIQSALDEFGNLRRAGPQDESGGDTATTREEAIAALRAVGVTDPTEEDILELLGR